MAQCYLGLEDYASARECAEKHLTVAHELHDKHGQAVASSVRLPFRSMQPPVPASLLQFWDSIRVPCVHVIRQVLGAVLLALGQAREALPKFQMHYAVSEELQDLAQLCEACAGLGMVFQVHALAPLPWPF